MASPNHEQTVLALDTGSPVISVGIATPGRVLAERSSDDARSSRRLLALVECCLKHASMSLREVDGVCALQGPGSFTGLRVGLATVLGFHQSLGLRATAIPTLTVLAAGSAGPRVLAVVDALRGQWFHQRFDGASPGQPVARSEAVCQEAGDLVFEDIDEVVGFGAQRLASVAPVGVTLTQPVSLAAGAARFAALADNWEPQRLVAPLYLRPPPARPGTRDTGPDS